MAGTWESIIGSIDLLVHNMMRPQTAKKQNIKTLEDWLDVFTDLDGYMVKGGQLLDLPLIDVRKLSPESQEIIGKRMGSERMARVCRFLSHIEQLVEAEGQGEKIGDVCTEEEIRAIWRASQAVEPA